MTISLNAAPAAWATDTNFSAGPNTGTPTKVNPGVGRFAQGWVPGDTLPAQHLNFHLAAVTTCLTELVAELPVAVDGVNGGTYELQSDLIFDGPAVFHIAGVQEIDNGADLIINSGGDLVVSAGGEILMADTDDLKINNQVGAFRLTLTPESIQPDTGGSAPSWEPRLSGVAFAGTPCGWFQADVNAAFCVAFPINLTPGDDIVTVVAQVDGSQSGVNHAALPGVGELPVLALVRVDGQGVATVVARRADQSGSLASYNALHTITLASGALDAGTLPHTVLSSDAYYVVLHGETGANAEADKFGLLSISGATVARSYRAEMVTL